MLYFDQDANLFTLQTKKRNMFSITPKDERTDSYCFHLFEYISGDMLYMYLGRDELEGIKKLIDSVLCTEDKESEPED